MFTQPDWEMGDALGYFSQYCCKKSEERSSSCRTSSQSPASMSDVAGICRVVGPLDANVGGHRRNECLHNRIGKWGMHWDTFPNTAVKNPRKGAPRVVPPPRALHRCRTSPGSAGS